jgi:hypothetical protein
MENRRIQSRRALFYYFLRGEEEEHCNDDIWLVCLLVFLLSLAMEREAAR